MLTVASLSLTLGWYLTFHYPSCIVAIGAAGHTLLASSFNGEHSQLTQTHRSLSCDSPQMCDEQVEAITLLVPQCS